MKKTKLNGVSLNLIKNAIKDIEKNNYYNYSYWGYRFNKVSNFITHKQHMVEMILKNIEKRRLLNGK